MIVNKPYLWLRQIATGEYEVNFVVQVDSNKGLSTSYTLSENPASKTKIVSVNLTGGSGGIFGLAPIQMNVNPVDWENISVEIHDNTHGNPLLGKSTAHSNEADASGGDEDEMLRPFFENFGITP